MYFPATRADNSKALQIEIKMLKYLRKRLHASVDARIASAQGAFVVQQEAALARRLASYAPLTAMSGWNGTGDPFAFHTQAAINAMSEGIAAIYGYDVDGAIAEFGTMTGRTATGIARAIASCDSTLAYAVSAYKHAPRKLYLFDSFIGLPASEKDSVDAQSPHVKDNVWSPGSCHGVSPDELRRMVGAHLAADRFEIVSGWFSDTVPALPGDLRFALLHVDSDLYSSAMDVLDGLFSRGMVQKGALIYFDDWNCNRADPQFGERRAWRDCVERYGIEYSDDGTYGIFARRFVVHNYRGSPE
ncbi:hypothetical protein Sa4125_14910 [Aureimonas sp. SA4125]|nr:hypothetical protein Sa4125_14910 [Aureimonas sp. SA4125]